MRFILGKKLKMAQLFDEKGNVIPVTLIEAGPCYITQKKTEEKDGYEAIQVGLGRIKKQTKIKKTQKGKEFEHLMEFRNGSDYKIGDEILASVFKEGDKVSISGITKGKGFAGGVKRWGFADQAKAHGVKASRRIGSIGSRFPQRVIKGRKMPGRMGGSRVTVSNLQIVKVDEKNNLIAIKGAIPGKRGTLVEIKSL